MAQLSLTSINLLTYFSTVKLFDRDPETNEVLWFAAPPLNMPHVKGPRHSLAYLQFLAAKRKRVTTEEEDGDQCAGVGEDWMDVEPNGSMMKRTWKVSYPQTVMEITRQVLSENGEEVQETNLG
jgi:chromatin structure-remodeling complex subunit RSC1/2